MMSISAIDLMRWVLNFFEVSSAVVGLICLKKLRPTYWHTLPFFLLWISLGELTGKFLRGYNENWNATLYSYLLIPSQFIYYYSLFYFYFKKLTNKRIVIVSMMLYIGLALYDLLGGHKNGYIFSSVSYDFGIVMLSAIIVIAVFQLVSAEEILNFRSNLMFWVTLGLFTGYVCTVPFYIWRKHLIATDNFVLIVFGFFLSLNYLMYLFFIIGFIKWKPKK